MSKHTDNLRIEPDYVSEVCTGIKVVVESGFENGISYEYAERIFDTILLETDEEYEGQKEQIEGVVNRVVTCVNAMEGLTNEEVEQLRANTAVMAVAFAEWMAAPGLHPEICAFMIPSEKYQYFIDKVYNQ